MLLESVDAPVRSFRLPIARRKARERLKGGHGVAIQVRRSAELADALPNEAYRTLPGRAHLPYLEAPDEIAALIMAEVV